MVKRRFLSKFFNVSCTCTISFGFFLLKLGFTQCKAEQQPLQGMELQEKETQKD